MHNYDLGNRIYQLRKSKNLSQKELGEMVGVSNKAVSKWENGTAIPKTDTLVKLAQILGVSPQEMLQGKTDNTLTLAQLSSQVNEMLLKEEIEKRDNDKRRYELKNQKRYIVILSSLFISTCIILLTLSLIDVGVYIEDGLKWYNILFDCVITGYLVSSIFSGIVFAVRLTKKLPVWALVIMCLLFPITILAIEFIGVVITPSYVITSIKGIIEDKKNGYSSNQ